MVPGFPNLFTITGPGSPGVLTNVPVAIEQHVEWIADVVGHLRDTATRRSRRRRTRRPQWTAHVQEVAHATLFPTADSWYMGANIPGKPRVFLPYLGGLGVYRKKCDAIAADGYARLRLRGRPCAGRSPSDAQDVVSGSWSTSELAARSRFGS